MYLVLFSQKRSCCNYPEVCYSSTQEGGHMALKASPFTDVINYRLLASFLRKRGVSEIPTELKNIRIAAQEGGVNLVRWVNKGIRFKQDEFFAALEFYIGEGQ